VRGINNGDIKKQEHLIETLSGMAAFANSSKTEPPASNHLFNRTDVGSRLVDIIASAR